MGTLYREGKKTKIMNSRFTYRKTGNNLLPGGPVALLLMALAALLPATGRAGTLAFRGASIPVLEVTPEKSTGLDRIYVAYNLEGVSAVYTASSDQAVTWYSYSSQGGGYAEPVEGVSRSGREYTLQGIPGERGYIVEEGTDRYYFWLVDYSDHRLYLDGIAPAAEQDCMATVLDVQMRGTPIHYYTINGRMQTLSQEIQLSYYTQEWNEQSEQFETLLKTDILESLQERLRVTPPAYCATTFHISGDRFLEQWNWLQEAESERVQPYAVEVRTFADQPRVDDPDNPSNVIGGGGDELGGSAPADITFRAECTEGVIHHEWQFASDMDFEDLLYRFNEQEVTYTFREDGYTYVRYIGSNASGECEAYGDVYTVHIGASELKCPNAFSPGASEGVNDEWKVSYRSLVEYECWIFNRHGEQLFHSTDPSEGWDGKKGGKLVKPGVYFYVIDAMGADGKHYKESGDINIINYRGAKASNTGATE